MYGGRYKMHDGWELLGVWVRGWDTTTEGKLDGVGESPECGGNGGSYNGMGNHKEWERSGKLLILILNEFWEELSFWRGIIARHPNASSKKWLMVPMYILETGFDWTPLHFEN